MRSTDMLSRHAEQACWEDVLGRQVQGRRKALVGRLTKSATALRIVFLRIVDCK